MGETRPSDVVGPIVVAMAVAAVLTWILGRLLGDRRRGALIVAPIVVGALMYGHVANLARPLHVPGLVQQAAWVALTAVAFVAAIRLPRPRLATLDLFLTRLTTVLVVVTLAVIVPFQVGSFLEPSSVAVAGPIQTTTSAQKRDVYYLIWDRYGSDRSLELRTGFQNDLTPWLRTTGSRPARQPRELRAHDALARDHAQHAAPRPAHQPARPRQPELPPPRRPAPGPGGPPPVPGARLSLHPHRVVVRRDRLRPSADVNYNWDGTSDFLEELYGASAGPALTKRLHIASVVPTHNEEHFEHGAFELARLDDMVEEPGPKFVFGARPRSPTLRTCSTPTAARSRPTRSRRCPSASGGAPARLHQRPDPGVRRGAPGAPAGTPADHHPAGRRGPLPRRYAATRNVYDWSTATPDELEMKFGIMNSWYLPDGEEDLGLYPTMTSINTFTTLFDGYFGLDYPKQPDTIYTSTSWLLPYGLTDVTDRIPGPH